MTDKRNRAKLFPIRLEGIQIAQAQQDAINTEILRRGGTVDPGKPSRLRNGIIRDFIDFTHEHYALFLTWVASRSSST